MEHQISFPKEREHSIRVENLHIRMLTYTPVQVRGDISDKYPLHTHTHAELFVCLEGSFDLRAADSLLTVGAGDLVIVPPRFPHHQLPVGEGAVWCGIGFTCSAGRRTTSGDLTRRIAALYNTDRLLLARGVPALCEGIARAVHAKNDPQLPAVHLCAILGELCGTELQKIGRGELTAPTASVEEGTDINRLSRLDYLINTCYMDVGLTVSRAAGLLYISQRQLERIMQARYGMSFHRKLCERRLEVAAHLLTQDPRPLEALCAAIGFPNRNAFTRAFKTRYGQSPSQFRANSQKSDPFRA